jgi:hypothetical protein
MFSYFVNGADVRMVEFRRGARFPQQPGSGGSVVKAGRRQNLDGDVPVKLLIVGPVNYTHTARAKLLDDAEVGECSADHGESLNWQRTHRNSSYLKSSPL